MSFALGDIGASVHTGGTAIYTVLDGWADTRIDIGAPTDAKGACALTNIRNHPAICSAKQGGNGPDEPSAKIEDTSPGTSMIELSRNH